jgi:hypothetical protein
MKHLKNIKKHLLLYTISGAYGQNATSEARARADRQLQLEFRNLYNIMGCVPPERKPSVAAASIAVKKSYSSKQLESKRNSSNSIDNNNLKASTETAPYFQVKQSQGR